MRATLSPKLPTAQFGDTSAHLATQTQGAMAPGRPGVPDRHRGKGIGTHVFPPHSPSSLAPNSQPLIPIYQVWSSTADLMKEAPNISQTHPSQRQGHRSRTVDL